nr:MAG TPA: hypothetical protein [Caudoviricetes sp.]
MDCETKEKSREEQSRNEETARVSFYCMIENQKNLIEVLKILNKCETMTCSNEMKSEYKKLIKKIENAYLREAKYVMGVRGVS